LEGITIRPIAPEDAEGLIAHWVGIASEPDIYVSYTPQEASIPVERQQEIIRRDLEMGNLCLVGESDTNVIAHISCLVDRPYSLTRHTATLGMTVDRRLRNHGIGTNLMEHAVRWAQENSIVRLQLEVYAANSPAIHLYKKFGFQVEGRKRMYAFQRGRYYDSLIMSRLFV
jgi:L-phenylalanine/L-methionine N-acetyltransferase